MFHCEQMTKCFMIYNMTKIYNWSINFIIANQIMFIDELHGIYQVF